MRIDNAVNIEDLRRLARRHSPRAVFDYVEGGVEDEIGMDRNRAAFDAVRIVPRYLVDVSQRSQKTTLFGREYAMPLGVAPMGLSGISRPGTDLALASAAGQAGIPFTLSNVSNDPMDQVVRAGNGQVFFQLYGTRNRGLMHGSVARAADLGVPVLMVTVDVPVHPNRERNARSGFGAAVKLKLPYLLEAARHPRWILEYLANGGVPKFMNLLSAQDTAASSAIEVARTSGEQMGDTTQVWRDFEDIRRRWPGKLVIKGVMHPDDARRAVELGADGVLVSNHGGRQLDLAPSPLEVLPAIRAALDPSIAVLFDSGVRRGSHVVAAMCLGADFVFAGRAMLYGAIAAREAGAARAIALLKREIDLQMGQMGCAGTDEFGPQWLLPRAG
ncbi:MAG: alpha-hydroxy-acid oxidizing protein [Burkholderiaceae bacterium]|nr:alpha-hydroxy-acid oxidizing protein [Burkholderiaceae bacterium]